MFIGDRNVHLKAISGVHAFAAEFVREVSFGPNGNLKQLGLIASADAIR